jgi:DNA mismatch repair protein MutS2
MQLEEYWGVGPKTRERLESTIGTEAAVQAIEGTDVRALTEAGLSRGRATRILRRATGGEGLDVLATSDARSVYKDLLDLAADHAVTDGAEDRIRVLTPLADRDAIQERLERVLAARDSWAALDEDARERVLEAFETYDERGENERSAVEAALALREAGVTEGAFAPLADLDDDDLTAAADALAALDDDGAVARGADDELDRLRDAAETVDRLEANALDLIEDLRSSGARDTAEFREAFVEHVRQEAPDVDTGRVRDAVPDDATDATDFVSGGLRALRSDLQAAADERASEVREGMEGDLEAARDDVAKAVETVDDVALYLSLARFADAYDMTRPEFGDGGVAVRDARNLDLESRDVDVQPVSYALGDTALDVGTDGERVAVLTGANSGGKTTLLETVCQVVLLAAMGLPVPADAAEVTAFDDLVFHRRHASFNAGVLESTLKSIVPPLSAGGRTLMLVDEFEAITEPGSAADLLHGLVNLTVERDAVGVFVTHLAEDLEPLPDEARVDGIFAEGLSPDLELLVDYQPRFDALGKSTPEFIVSRLVADATDRTTRAGFRTLADAVDTEAVQRTLADAQWE